MTILIQILHTLISRSLLTNRKMVTKKSVKPFQNCWD